MSNIVYDKPFKTYEEQLKLIESRGVLVTDRAFARRALSEFSYYTLVNGYKDAVFSTPNKDTFLPGTTMDLLYWLHTTDTSVQAVILKYILYAERSLKSHLSYLISEQYGVYTDYNDPTSTNPDDYLCRSNYGNSDKKNNTIRDFKNLLLGTYHYQNSSVNHYLQNHNHVPPWILVTSLTLGDIIRWYDILKPVDKSAICASFIDNTLDIEKSKEFFKKSFNLLREFRNSIAHGNRTMFLTGTNKLPKEQTIKLSKGIIKNNEYNNDDHFKCGLPAVVVALLSLLNDPVLQMGLTTELIDIFKDFSKSGVAFPGKSTMALFYLPDDFEDRLHSYFSKPVPQMQRK